MTNDNHNTEARYRKRHAQHCEAAGLAGVTVYVHPDDVMAVEKHATMLGNARGLRNTVFDWEVFQAHIERFSDPSRPACNPYPHFNSDQPKTQAEREANPALIAAAPQLLDAAQAAAELLAPQKWNSDDTFNPEVIVLAKLLAAIAAATTQRSA